MNYISECQPKSYCQNAHFISLKAEICCFFCFFFLMENKSQKLLKLKKRLSTICIQEKFKTLPSALQNWFRN